MEDGVVFLHKKGSFKTLLLLQKTDKVVLYDSFCEHRGIEHHGNKDRSQGERDSRRGRRSWWVRSGCWCGPKVAED